MYHGLLFIPGPFYAEILLENWKRKRNQRKSDTSDLVKINASRVQLFFHCSDIWCTVADIIFRSFFSNLSFPIDDIRIRIYIILLDNFFTRETEV